MVTKAQTQHVAKQLAHQHFQTALRHDAAEARRDENACRVLSQRIAALAEEVSFHPAGSPEGALFMASVLRSDIDLLMNGETVDELYDRMSRLAVALVQYLEQTTGLKRRGLRLDWYGGAELDGLPFGRAVA